MYVNIQTQIGNQWVNLEEPIRVNTHSGRSHRVTITREFEPLTPVRLNFVGGGTLESHILPGIIRRTDTLLPDSYGRFRSEEGFYTTLR